MMKLAEFQEILAAREDEHLEFKEAKHNFHFERLIKYCVALANEGGGKIILGVTDQPPRRVVGSHQRTAHVCGFDFAGSASGSRQASGTG